MNSIELTNALLGIIATTLFAIYCVLLFKDFGGKK